MLRLPATLSLIALFGCSPTPGAVDAAIGPDAAKTTDDLVLTLNAGPASDEPDGYRIAWFVDGQAVPDRADLRGVPSALTARDQVWEARIVPMLGDQEGAEAFAEITIANSAPLLEIVSVAKGPSTDQDLNVEVETFDADGDAVEVSWSWTVDGVPTDDDGPTVDSVHTARGQVWQVRAVASDGDDQSAFAEAEIVVGNTRPELVSIALSPSAPTTETDLVASSEGFDADGDDVDFSYVWRVNGQIADAEGPVLSAVAFVRGDLVEVEVRPHDGLNEGAPGFASIEIDNVMPHVEGAALSPSSPRTTDAVRCDGVGWFDADEDPARYERAWYVDDVPVGDAEVLSADLFVKNQEIRCDLTPVDAFDQGTRVSATSRSINTPPLLLAVFLSDDMPTSGQTLTATGMGAHDADGDDVSLAYAWYVDGNDAGSGRDLSLSGVPRDSMVHVVVTPSDDEGPGETVSSHPVKVVNAPPVISSVSLSSEGELYTDGVLSASVDASDVDGDDLTVNYAWFVNGARIAYTGSSLGGEHFSQGEEIQVQVEVSDGVVTVESERSAPIVVANSKPVVGMVDLSPRPPTRADALTCAASDVTDKDDHDVSLGYAWYIDDVLVDLSGAGGADLSPGAFVRGEIVRCEATPYDGIDVGEAVSSAGVVVENSPPELASVAIDVDEARNGTTLSAILEGLADADDDEITLSYAWRVDGVEAGSDTTFDVSGVAAGSTIDVAITPNDGIVDGSTVDSVAIPVVNSAPVLSAVALLPEDPRIASTLALHYEASDVDGDDLTANIVWTVNGATAMVKGSEVSVAAIAVKGDVISAQIDVSDGELSSEVEVVGPYEVLNTAPTAPEVVLSSEDPIEGAEDLICLLDVASIDADEDVIEYTFTWTLDGADYAGAVTTDLDGDTIPASVTVDGQEWVCRVSASDGEDKSDVDEASATVIKWTGERVFSTCGATGSEGPAQLACDDSYAATRLEDEVVVEAGFQVWTAPITGSYRVIAVGAAGVSGGATYAGGRGAQVAGTLFLESGDKLKIAVGQAGSSDGCNGGGGGGTWVLGAEDEPLVVAGGGGGTRTAAAQAGCDARIEEAGGLGSGSSPTSSCALKTSGVGDGGVISSGTYGSGGGGALSNGADDMSAGRGGRSSVNGSLGGSGSAAGGFGGGGSGHGSCGGGGGGGYSGGDGGFIAGGGGSYNAGTDPAAVVGIGTAAGEVSIDLLE